MDLSRIKTNKRDLKKPGRDELGRLWELNLLIRACARELISLLSSLFKDAIYPDLSLHRKREYSHFSPL